MKTEYDAYAAFLYPNTGEQERRFFYALMLRSRGKKSLTTIGFAGALLPGTGILPNPGKTAFYRVTNPQPKE